MSLHQSGGLPFFMDSSHLVTLAVIALCVIMSAYFSATETAYSSLSRVRMKNMASDGNKRAALVLRQSENYDKLISTILIGNNIVNILATSLATVFFMSLFPKTGATISTIVMTLVILIFGEISPKSIAKDVPERFSMFSAPLMNVLLTILAPLNFIFSQWKKLLTVVFKIPESHGITEDELLTIVDEAQDGGGIDHEEGAMIRSVIEFNDLEVADICTPRVDVCAIDIETSKDEILDTFRESGFSRLIVYQDSIDNVVGVLHEKDFYNNVIHENKPLETAIQKPFFVPSTMDISKLLRQLQSRRSHIAIVSDDFGGMMGIVTMEDIIEELIGEIWDEHDEIINEITQIDENSWQVDCGMRAEKLFEHFEIENAPEDVSTVSGWILDSFGFIPQCGDSFTFGNLEITVTETDGQRLRYAVVKNIANIDDKPKTEEVTA